MKKYIIENGIKYELCGDVYYPMLKLDEQTNYQIGKYGCLHLDYIKQHCTNILIHVLLFVVLCGKI